jgi:hypothetical protein
MQNQHDARTDEEKKATMDKFVAETPHSDVKLPDRNRNPITGLPIDDDPDE